MIYDFIIILFIYILLKTIFKFIFNYKVIFIFYKT